MHNWEVYPGMVYAFLYGAIAGICLSTLAWWGFFKRSKIEYLFKKLERGRSK